MTALDVRPARVNELPLCSALLQESARWAIEQGIPLWDEASLTVEALTRSYHPAEFRLGWLEGEPVATMALQREDPLFWPEANPGEALYLHKLAVGRAYAGRGLAQAMLRAGLAEARSLNLPFLRLDTAADRPKLRALYEDFGFQSRGERQVGVYRVVLYELTVEPQR